ncbi:MAG: DUF2125 domain-containing protein [Paracoccaceae bacterium]
MLRPRFPRATAAGPILAAILGLSAAAPAGAQVSAAAGWEALTGALRDAGATVTATGPRMDGADLHYVDVTVGHGPVSVHFDRLEIAPVDGAARLSLPPRVVVSARGASATLSLGTGAVTVTEAAPLTARIDAAELRLTASGTRTVTLAALRGALAGASATLSLRDFDLALDDLTAATATASMRADWAADLDVEVTTGPMRTAMATAHGPVATRSQAERARLTLTPDTVRLAHAMTAPRVTLDAAGAQADDWSLTLAWPRDLGPDPTAASIDLALSDLRADEALWDRLDPGATIPRGPLALRLAANAVLRAGPGDLPEPVALDLSALSVGALGATLSAAGALTFDATDRDAFAPWPAPRGEVVVTATGLPELIELGLAAGVLTPARALPARLALGALTRPDGAGGVTTTLTFDAGGRLSANGQRLR